MNGKVGGRGNKNSGRKKKAEELRIYIEKIKEQITNDALVELSRKTVYTAIKEYPSIITAKELALPIQLKSMTDKKEVIVKDFNKLLNEA